MRTGPGRALVAVLACCIALAGCGEDNESALTPVTEALRAQPGITDVDDFYSPPQLKVAEAYEAVAHPHWSATPQQVCATIRTFVEATSQVGADPRIMRLSLRHADEGRDYPHPWSFTLGISHGTTDELIERCLFAHRLRDLPAGSSAMVDTRENHTSMRIEVPRFRVDTTDAAKELVSDLLGIAPQAFDEWERTGYEIRVDVPKDRGESTEPAP